MPADLLTVHSYGVCFHVLRCPDGLYLIDAGFVGASRNLRRALAENGWDRKPILGIILTHGHFDHIANVPDMVSETGAWVAAPRLDLAHYAGCAEYSGCGQVTGWLEAGGRRIFSFRPFVPDRLLDDGDTLDLWHGLRTVHLPGHTPGHSGYFCDKTGLLFTGDLFASYSHGLSHLPPAIFNHDRDALMESVHKALSLEPSGVIPNHGGMATPAEHLTRLRDLWKRRR
jgi:glyoxylase-like metal-dependent hydrolase (beta-lactamase superfamily II)